MNQELVNLISNVGFPIVMCLLLTLRLEKKLDELIAVVKNH
jgi:hypothetical protein